MDETHKKILALLQEDCFLPQTEIAHAVGRVMRNLNKTASRVSIGRNSVRPGRVPVLAFVNVPIA